MDRSDKHKLLDALVALFQGGARDAPDERENYAAFLALTEPDGAGLARERAYAPSDPVRFVICIPGGAGREASRSVASLDAQTYRHFELVHDPVSADGDFVLTLRAGDTLTPDALYCFARRIEAKPEAKLLYADEDCLLNGRRARPILKPDYSEAAALSHDLTGAPLAASKALYDVCASPGMREYLPPGESYAFALRCLAKAGGAEHIPRVLYTRAAPPEPPGSAEGCEALERYLLATNQKAEPSAGLWPGSFHVRASSRAKERIAIVIPNRDGADELRRLLESIEETCAFYKPHIVVADAGSTSERTLRYYDILEKNKAARVVTRAGAGFSALCNAAANAVSANGLLFLARDLELFTPDLIGEMRAQALRRGAGAVGCTLVDGQGRLAHTGYVVGLCGALESPYAGEEEAGGSKRKLGFTRTLRAVSAVSGACLYVGAEPFFEAGRFDESFDRPGEILPCGADAEFCIRLMRRGLTNIYTPFARALLHARLPRIEEADARVRMRAYDVLRPVLDAGDPYFNPNYARRSRVPVVKTQAKDEPPEKF